MATDTSTNSQPQSNLQTNPFGDAIVKKMLESTGIISSTTSNIDERIASAIAGVKESTTKSNEVVNSQFGRELGYIQENANQSQISGRAAGSGGVLNVAALRELTMTTDKSLKDLDQRRQELILQNDAQGAAQVSALQIQALDFKQKAEQQTFANLLGMANFSVQQSQEKRLSQAQSFSERSAIASIGLQYGVPVTEADTMETIMAKVAPLASQKQKLELQKTQAEIKRINAETNKALQGDINEKSFDPLVAESLGLAFRQGQPGFLANIKTNEQAAAVKNAVERQNKEQQKYIEGNIESYLQLGNADAIKRAIANDPNIIIDPAGADAIVLQVMASKPKGDSIFKKFLDFNKPKPNQATAHLRDTRQQ